MAKGAYIGVNDVAKKVKSTYIGVNEEVPVYSDSEITLEIKSVADLYEVFSVANNVTNKETFQVGSNGDDGVFEHVSSADNSSIWTARYDIKSISFDYYLDTGYDATICVAGNTVVFAYAGVEEAGSWSGSMNAGQTIEFVSDGYAGTSTYISNIRVVYTGKVQTGTTTKSVAHKVKKAYIGVNGVAQALWNYPCYRVSFNKQGSSTDVTVTDSYSGKNADSQWELFMTAHGQASISSGYRMATINIGNEDMAGKTLSFRHFVHNYTSDRATCGLSYKDANDEFITSFDGLNHGHSMLFRSNDGKWIEESVTIPEGATLIRFFVLIAPDSDSYTRTTHLLLDDVRIDGERIM